MIDIDEEEWDAMTDAEKREYEEYCDEEWQEHLDGMMAECRCGAHQWSKKMGEFVTVADCVCGAF